MEKSIVRRLPNLSEEDKRAEEYFITEACEGTDYYLKKYQMHASSFNGRYIGADLFKETFDIYSESPQTRNLYASAVHNSAACLSNELFQKVVKDPSITDCIFLTGIPGAGKSFLIQSLILENKIPESTMIFEGDVNSRETIKEKMQLAFDNDKKVHLMIVNPTIELAYRNATNRLEEIGRGASMHTIARIASGLPESVQFLYDYFNGNISIGIYSKKSNYDIEIQEGIEAVDVLQKGNYEEIKEQLAEIRKKIIEEELEKKKMLEEAKKELRGMNR